MSIVGGIITMGYGRQPEAAAVGAEGALVYQLDAELTFQPDEDLSHQLAGPISHQLDEEESARLAAGLTYQVD